MDRFLADGRDLFPHAVFLHRGMSPFYPSPFPIPAANHPQLGLVASVVFSLILVIQSTSQPRIKIIGRVPGTNEWVPIDEDESAQEEIPGVLVVRIRENLSFANTGQLKERLRRVSRFVFRRHPLPLPLTTDVEVYCTGAEV